MGVRGQKIMMEQLIVQFETTLGQSVLFAHVAAYLAGVLVSFTPCVYPVIPLTVAVIGGQEKVSGARGFVLSMFFVLGLALTYTILGFVAALTGKLFGSIQTHPLTMGGLGILFVIMGLAMMEVFQLSLDRFVPRGLSAGNRKGILGSFLVGATSGLVLGPCTTPVLAVVLGVVATKQNMLFGGSLLFVFSLGMGSLLMLVGTFTGLIASMPKSGAWMNAVKKFSGIVMLAVGAYFLYSALIS
jgi:thiol:disulfide interchange protein DsbD